MPLRTMRAGFPATMQPGGTSRVTTLPAPTIELSPMLTPGIRMLWAPMKQRSPTRVSA